MTAPTVNFIKFCICNCFTCLFCILYVCDVLVNGQETCGGLLTDPSGEFSSPDLDGDFKYDNNMYCVWTITANLSQVIDIQFYYVELEDSAGCLYDYVEVNNFCYYKVAWRKVN